MNCQGQRPHVAPRTADTADRGLSPDHWPAGVYLGVQRLVPGDDPKSGGLLRSTRDRSSRPVMSATQVSSIRAPSWSVAVLTTPLSGCGVDGVDLPVGAPASPPRTPTTGRAPRRRWRCARAACGRTRPRPGGPAPAADSCRGSRRSPRSARRFVGGVVAGGVAGPRVDHQQVVDVVAGGQVGDRTRLRPCRSAWRSPSGRCSTASWPRRPRPTVRIRRRSARGCVTRSTTTSTPPVHSTSARGARRRDPLRRHRPDRARGTHRARGADRRRHHAPDLTAGRARRGQNAGMSIENSITSSRFVPAWVLALPSEDAARASRPGSTARCSRSPG